MEKCSIALAVVLESHCGWERHMFSSFSDQTAEFACGHWTRPTDFGLFLCSIFKERLKSQLPLCFIREGLQLAVAGEVMRMRSSLLQVL